MVFIELLSIYYLLYLLNYYRFIIYCIYWITIDLLFIVII